jgi:hypothetical protein
MTSGNLSMFSPRLLAPHQEACSERQNNIFILILIYAELANMPDAGGKCMEGYSD